MQLLRRTKEEFTVLLSELVQVVVQSFMLSQHVDLLELMTETVTTVFKSKHPILQEQACQVSHFMFGFFESNMRSHPDLTAAYFRFVHVNIWKCAYIFDDPVLQGQLWYWATMALMQPELTVVTHAGQTLKDLARHVAKKNAPLPACVEQHGLLLLDTILRGASGGLNADALPTLADVMLAMNVNFGEFVAVNLARLLAQPNYPNSRIAPQVRDQEEKERKDIKEGRKEERRRRRKRDKAQKGYQW